MLPHYHTLYLETTRKCNLSCPHCSTGSNGKYDGSENMSYDDILSRILYPAFQAGTRFLAFSGGEFLLRKDAFDLLDQAKKIGFSIGIASNGTTLNEKTVKKIKSLLGNKVIISLGINSFDGDNEKTRDRSFKRTVEIIGLLGKNNIRINISIVTGEFNKHTFEDTVKKIKNLKLPFNRIPFVPRNSESHHLMLNKNTLRKYFHPVLRREFKGCTSYHPFFLSGEAYKRICGQSEKEDVVPTNPSIGCWVGSFYAINPEGEVSPCPLLSDHLSGGNVLKEDLQEILMESKLFKRIIQRDKLEGKCGSCKFRFTCGGCRAMAYYQTGNVFAEDPNCFLEDLTESELKAMEKETEGSFKNYVRMASLGGMFKSPN